MRPADAALTLLRIHSETLYKARAACKMVCEVRQRKILLRFFNNEHFNRHICRNQFKAELVEKGLLHVLLLGFTRSRIPFKVKVVMLSQSGLIYHWFSQQLLKPWNLVV